MCFVMVIIWLWDFDFRAHEMALSKGFLWLIKVGDYERAFSIMSLDLISKKLNMFTCSYTMAIFGSKKNGKYLNMFAHSCGVIIINNKNKKEEIWWKENKRKVKINKLFSMLF